MTKNALKYLLLVFLFGAFFSCEVEEEEPLNLCEPRFSNRADAYDIQDHLGEIKELSGYFVIYNPNTLTHYYACNLPSKWENLGETVYYHGVAKSDIAYFVTDSITGNAEPVVDKGPCEIIEQEAGPGCQCKLIELSEIWPSNQSGPVW